MLGPTYVSQTGWALIRVLSLAQIRPLLGKELLQSDEWCLQVVNPDQVVLGRDRIFRFDGVFQPDATQVGVAVGGVSQYMYYAPMYYAPMYQDAVYEGSVQPLIKACLDGYNMTVLAYGQTGSGKSFTMGSEDTLGSITSEGRGLIPR